MKFIVDKEINLLDEHDEFETSHYSETLADIVDSAPKSSFTIGLFGEWGTGKSSIIKTAEDILSRRGKKYHFITYDSWKYSNDSFRRTFLLKVEQELKIKTSDKFNFFYKSSTKTTSVDNKINNVFLISFIILSIALIWVAIGYEGEITKGLTIHSFILFGLIVVNFLANLFKKESVTIQEPMIFAPEQFEECFESMLSSVLINKSPAGKFGDWIIGKSEIRSLDKLIIVIDNIDRCDSKSAYELLSTIKTFFGYNDIVFIMPVDDTALRQHVAETTKTNMREADEFLRKLFNNTLKIKPYKKTDLYAYAENISDSNSLNLLPDTIEVDPIPDTVNPLL